MAAELTKLRSPAAVQAALDEFSALGRTEFLKRYAFGKARDYLVRNPRTGDLCDSKAIVGAAYGFEHPDEGPLKPADFSGGEGTVVPKLHALGFEVVRIGEDWSPDEVAATIESYFQMLRREARQEAYKKTEFNASLREALRARSKASVELKHQNVSAVLMSLDLPYIPGYKPRGNAQLLLRKAVQKYVLEHAEVIREIVDAMEELNAPAERRFRAVVVDPPKLETVVLSAEREKRLRLPRKLDYVARDEQNRRLGRAGEQWALDFEQKRLTDAGLAELFQRVDWVSERLGDGAGYDILSYDSRDRQRFIEVKTTNQGYASAFVVTRNELEFAQEVGEAFHLYRVFAFRESPSLYMLRGDISKQLHLEPLDYRASFRRLVA